MIIFTSNTGPTAGLAAAFDTKISIPPYLATVSLNNLTLSSALDT